MSGSGEPPRRWRVTVCCGPECGDKRNSQALYDELVRLIAERGLGPTVVLDWQACFGRCFHGPNVYIRPDRPVVKSLSSMFGDALPIGGPGAALYVELTPEKLGEIVEEHLISGRVVKAFKYKGN